MAITKEIITDKVEVVGKFKLIQVRNATVIKEDGKEISRSFQRYVVTPDISAENLAKQNADVQAMHNQLHTDEIKQAFAAHLAEND